MFLPSHHGGPSLLSRQEGRAGEASDRLTIATSDCSKGRLPQQKDPRLNKSVREGGVVYEARPAEGLLPSQGSGIRSEEVGTSNQVPYVPVQSDVMWGAPSTFRRLMQSIFSKDADQSNCCCLFG